MMYGWHLRLIGSPTGRPLALLTATTIARFWDSAHRLKRICKTGGGGGEGTGVVVLDYCLHHGQVQCDHNREFSLRWTQDSTHNDNFLYILDDHSCAYRSMAASSTRGHVNYGSTQAS